MIPRLFRGLKVHPCQARLMSTEPPKENAGHEREMKNFSQMSADWWDYNGPAKALHSMNSLRIPLIRNGLMNTKRIPCNAECLPDPFKGVKILDVGCGGGILSIPLGRLGAEVTGIDPNLDLVKTAEERLKVEGKINVQFKNEGLEDHVKCNPEAYDVLVLSEVIEHVQSQDAFLHKCVEGIKPGGSIFITTLNKTAMSWALGIVMAEYVLRLLPPGTHDYNKFIRPSTIREYLSQVGCDTKLISGMAYNPINNTWYWCQSTVINYALHAVKIAV